MTSLKEPKSNNHSLETGRKGPFYYGWVVMGSCLVVLATAIGMRYSFGVFFQALEQDFGLNRAMTSGIFSIHMVLSCIGTLFGGWALDRYGPRRVGVLMGFFTGLSLLLTSQADSVWHLYICYGLLLALGTMAAYPIATATTSRWFIKKRGIALGIISSGPSIGLLVMAPIAAYFINTYGWRTSYIVMGFIAWTLIMGSSLFMRKEPSEIGVLPDGEILTLGEIVAKDQPNDSGPGEISLTQALKTRGFWLIMLVASLYAFCFHMVLTHLIRYAVDLEISPTRSTATLTFMACVNIPGRLLGGRMSDNVRMRELAIVCALFQAGAMVLLMGSINMLILYLFALFYGFTSGMMDPLVPVLIAETFGLRNVGVMMGIQCFFWGIGAAIGPTLAGYIYDINGRYTIAFLTGAISMLLTAACFYMLKTPKTMNSVL